MPRFTKRPVTVEARQWDGSALVAAQLIGWIASVGGRAKYRTASENMLPARIEISTLEGEMIASRGDWIICGVQKEFYPVKSSIFDATYEVAE